MFTEYGSRRKNILSTTIIIYWVTRRVAVHTLQLTKKTGLNKKYLLARKIQKKMIHS